MGAPQVVDQTVDGDHLARADRQHGQERPELGAGHSHWHTGSVDHLKGPEEPDLHN